MGDSFPPLCPLAYCLQQRGRCCEGWGHPSEAGDELLSLPAHELEERLQGNNSRLYGRFELAVDGRDDTKLII